jgi:hypothetical protein
MRCSVQIHRVRLTGRKPGDGLCAQLSKAELRHHGETVVNNAAADVANRIMRQMARVNADLLTVSTASYIPAAVIRGRIAIPEKTGRPGEVVAGSGSLQRTFDDHWRREVADEVQTREATREADGRRVGQGTSPEEHDHQMAWLVAHPKRLRGVPESEHIHLPMAASSA